jgi:hypothetical protein
MHNNPNVLAAVLAVLAMAGCASDPQVTEQAGRGAAVGAVGGAVAGAVGSLLWGGNVVEGAVKGGVTGAATGAAVGAMSGAAADSAAKERSTPKPDPKLAELRQRIGDRNYASALLLAQCKHRDAIASAEETLGATQDRQQRTYALMIQGIAAEESGDKTLAASIYPKIVQEDASRGSVDKLRADTLEGVIKVQAARRDHGFPPTCK